VTTEPSSDTVWPAQSFMKSACRHNDTVTGLDGSIATLSAGALGGGA
jgi:hypothetical protein